MQIRSAGIRVRLIYPQAPLLPSALDMNQSKCVGPTTGAKSYKARQALCVRNRLQVAWPKCRVSHIVWLRTETQVGEP